MIKVKTKYICIICQNYVKKNKGQFTCPVCGNITKANEIIEEFNEPSIWYKLKVFFSFIRG